MKFDKDVLTFLVAVIVLIFITMNVYKSNYGGMLRNGFQKKEY